MTPFTLLLNVVIISAKACVDQSELHPFAKELVKGGINRARDLVLKAIAETILETQCSETLKVRTLQNLAQELHIQRIEFYLLDEPTQTGIFLIRGGEVLPFCQRLRLTPFSLEANPELTKRLAHVSPQNRLLVYNRDALS